MLERALFQRLNEGGSPGPSAPIPSLFLRFYCWALQRGSLPLATPGGSGPNSLCDPGLQGRAPGRHCQAGKALGLSRLWGRSPGDVSLPCPQPLPSCLRFVQTNISHLLQDTSQQLAALKPWITRRNFSGCLELQCQPGKSPPSIPQPPSPPPSHSPSHTLSWSAQTPLCSHWLCDFGRVPPSSVL